MVTSFTYDSFENLITQVSDSGSGHLNVTTRFTYDALGNVIARTDPNGSTTTMTYDADRRLLTRTAPAPFNSGLSLVQTTNAYDPDGHLLSVTRTNGASNVVTSMSYTATGQVQTVTDPRGNVTSNSYDADDRLASVTDPVGRVTSYGYDAMGRRISVSNPAIQGTPLLQQTYTPDGLIGGLTDANNHTTTFTLDGFDRLSTTTYPGGGIEVLTYDADSNVLTQKTRANQTITFTYDTLNRLATKATPSEPTVTYGYDLAGRQISVSDNSVSIARPSTSASYASSLTYDQLNRPLSVNWNPVPGQTTPSAATAAFTFGYDATNRRVSQAANDNSWWNYPTAASSVSYTANNLNQYTAVGTVTPTYDNNGNLTSDGTFTFGYDAENRLISASGAGNSAAYAYDAQGRRKSKTVNGAATVYITDANNREILEYDGTSGAIKNWYAYGLGPNDVLNQMNVAAATRATLIPDVQGSIVGTLDATSGTLTKVGYRPYGESSSTSGSFRYTAQRIDPETNGLYYYRARQYIPAWGRFMQPDPIGYSGGNNLYAYVSNDPLNAADPTGLDTQITIGYTQTPIRGTYHQVVTLTDTVTGQQYATRAGPTSQSVSDYLSNGFGPIYAQSGVLGPTFRDRPSSIVATQAVGTIPRDYSESVANAVEFQNVTNASAIPYQLSGPNSNSYATTFVQSLTGTRPAPILTSPGSEVGTPSSQLSYGPSQLEVGGLTANAASSSLYGNSEK